MPVIGRSRRFAPVAALALLFVGASTAVAAPHSGPVWVVTSTSTPYQAAPPPTPDVVPSTAADDPDFKSQCQTQPQAREARGWAKSRYEQCFVGHRKYELKVRPDAPTFIASVEFDYTVLAFTRDDVRKVDYSVLLDNYRTLGGQERLISTLLISFTGCGTTGVECSPLQLQERDTLEGWKTHLQFVGQVTSPDTAGSGDHKLVPATFLFNLALESNLPDVKSEYDNAIGVSAVRFDSAGAVAGKARGAVFTDNVPTFDLLAIADAKGRRSEILESARHIDDAINHPERTFPSFIGKNVPGGAADRPLHRMINEDDNNKNRTYSGKVCPDVWGDLYPKPLYNCDEYPFASTYEGAFTGSGNGARPWNGSSRPITAADNQLSGTWLINDFYKLNRLLDKDVFLVSMHL